MLPAIRGLVLIAAFFIVPAQANAARWVLFYDLTASDNHQETFKVDLGVPSVQGQLFEFTGGFSSVTPIDTQITGTKVLDDGTVVQTVYYDILLPVCDTCQHPPISLDLGVGTTQLILFYSSAVDAFIYGGVSLPDETLPVPPVPELSTWAMLLMGFAGIGFVTYRRRATLRLQHYANPSRVSV